jgi:cobyrinic acid a,c-diamide synthase
VILVLDATGQTATAAAVAFGCARYRPDVEIAGVILNRVGSERHVALIRRGFDHIGLPVFGALPREDGFTLPERHLGLVQAVEHDGLADHLDRLGEAMARVVDLDAIRTAARPAKALVTSGGEEKNALLPPPGQRIALAWDQVFSFIYPHMLQGWREAGAEILPFSPLADEAPDPAADAVWLPGGYPELHAGRLAAAETFRRGMQEHAARGVPIHGECGGYMALGAGLEDAEGQRHVMLGLLSAETSFRRRKLSLGYRRARLLAPCPLGPVGADIFGHEFHYAALLANRDEPLASCSDAAGLPVEETGARRGNVTGGFFHAISMAGAVHDDPSR